MDTVRKI